METRKRAVSVRMSVNDMRNVQLLAKRLAVRDSEVIRFAVKIMLSKLAPLYDMTTRGRNLVPVFVESGPDIFRYLELDAARLDAIINEGVADEARVTHDDIQLIAMSGIQQSYAKLRLTRISGGKSTVVRQEATAVPQEELGNTLRTYLYEKYVYGANGG